MKLDIQWAEIPIAKLEGRKASTSISSQRVGSNDWGYKCVSLARKLGEL
jgi:hypothetical protein